MSEVSVLKPSATDEKALTALRQATRAHHNALEAQLGLAQPNLGLARYGRILQGFEAFLRSWEPQVSAALPTRLHSWLQGRSRLALLQRDLDTLGLRPRPLPVWMPLPGLAEAFGSLYVMEGSALGGQVIVRQVAHVGLTPGQGASYFYGWGTRTGALWKDFCQHLEQEIGDHSEAVARACAAACLTFETLGTAFNRIEHASV